MTGFSPYTNRPGMIEPPVLGIFTHDDTGVLFEYSNREKGCRGGWGPKYPHRIFTRDGDRIALIKKTVAYVVCGETPEGEPIAEKWQIKKHRFYSQEEMATRYSNSLLNAALKLIE